MRHSAASGQPRLRRGRHGCAELQKLKAERDTLLDRLARMQAEFENARKRAARDQQEFREFALADAIKALLAGARQFRARVAGGAIGEIGVPQWDGAHLQPIAGRAGRSWGCVPFPPREKPFDPHLHEAIEMVDTSEVRGS